jgi:hypothetical protein
MHISCELHLREGFSSLAEYIAGILGSIHTNNNKNNGLWQDCLLRPWVFRCTVMRCNGMVNDLDMIAESGCSASSLLVAGPQYQEIEAVECT